MLHFRANRISSCFEVVPLLLTFTDDKIATTNDMTTTEYINPGSLMASITKEVTEARDTTRSSSTFVTSTTGFSKGLRSTGM